MQTKQQSYNLIFRTISRAATAALAIATVFALTVVLTQSAQAQTFKVIHNFTGGGDGGNSNAALTMDRAGNLYGTTTTGTTVFKLSHRGPDWVLNNLYTYAGGVWELSAVTFGPDGSLYGTGTLGPGGDCGGNGCGGVFKLQPPPTACKTALCPWTETQLYGFTGGADGYYPQGGVIFDHAGNIYGVTTQGGSRGGSGTVYVLTPSGSGWMKNVLYSLGNGPDGQHPQSGVILDGIGNLYFSTASTVDELTPSNGSWIEHTLYGGAGGSLLFDRPGNLYSSTAGGGPDGGGTVFELTPSGGNWTYSLLYSFTGCCGPSGPLAMDAAGNLYGATWAEGAYGAGNVFKLTPSGSGWTYTDLYDFTGGTDGNQPRGGVIVDANGNLYGTAYRGGTGSCGFGWGCGVVWEITP